MEFVISNFPIANFTKVNELYIDGRFQDSPEHLVLFEGEIINEETIDPLKSFKQIFEDDKIGNFNHLVYFKKDNKLRIKNDKFGTYPLFIYCNSNRLLISNNVWKIVRHLDKSDVVIDKEYFKFMIGSWGNHPDGNTLFKGIIELNAGHIADIDLTSLSIDLKKYYSLEQSTSNFHSLDEAVRLLDQDLSFTFERMANLNKDATLGFGNSGGLDSRLVPIYAQEQNIEMAGITTVNKRSNSLLRSLTALNASKIAEIYQFRNHYMSHVIDAVEDRMILDIRNNPFGTCEVFKNPYKSLPSFNYYVTGGNGFIVGGAWTKYLNLNKDSEFLDAFYSYHSKLSAFGWIAEGAELVNKFFSKEDLDIFKNYKRRFYEENKHKSNLGIIRSYHQYCLNKRSPLGGFESVNGLYKTYNIYYPIVFEHTLSWNPDYFPNRIVLKRLIERKSPELFKIRSQNYDRLNGKPLNILEKVERRIALKYRGWGLDYENWAKEEGFKRYMTRTFSQKNELFFENLGLNHKEFVDLQIENKLRPHVFLDILKLKKIMDIVQKGDYEFASDKSLEIKRPQ